MTQNPWENADALLMCVRLRRKGIILPDVDALFAEVLKSIILMATRLLIIDDPRFASKRDFLFDYETQTDVLLQVLTKLNKAKLRSSKSFVNWIVKASQNALRNIVRDSTRLKRTGTLLGEGDVDLDFIGYCRDFYGNIYKREDGHKVSNINWEE